MKLMGLILCGVAMACGAQTVNGHVQIGGAVLLGVPSGTLTISTPVPTATDTTISATFSSNIPATPDLKCGPSTPTKDAIDAGIDRSGPLNHTQIVAGLSASTAYSCQASVTANATTVTANFSISTTATPATTPITSLTLGTPSAYNSINPSNQGMADTFYNCKSSDGNSYMVNDDTSGFTISGVPSFTAGLNAGGQQSVMAVTNESPLTIQTVNMFPLYGPWHGPGGTPVYLSDGLSSKAFGIFCLQGNLFLQVGRQNQSNSQPGGGLALTKGNILMSANHGLTWNNPDNINTFGNVPRSNLTSSMFAGSPTTMGGADFIHYCADDGTLGYTIPCNEHDQGNAYVYLMANEGITQGGGTAGGGNDLYLARVPRAKLQNLSGADYQWYVSGTCSADGSWSSTESSATSMVHNPGEIGTGHVHFIPALNRYLYLTYYYPSGVLTGGNVFDSWWLGYEAPTPCGPWTLIYSQHFTGGSGGAYNPILLDDTTYSGTTPTVMWTPSFGSVPLYVMNYATLTIN
jgi:hypothetical protein